MKRGRNIREEGSSESAASSTEQSRGMALRSRIDEPPEEISSLGQEIFELISNTNQSSAIKGSTLEKRLRKFEEYKEEIGAIMDRSFASSELVVRKRDEQIAIQESSAMAEQEKDTIENVRRRFVSEMDRLSHAIINSPDFTIGDQARLFQLIQTTLYDKLAGRVGQTMEPDQMARLSELITIAYNESLKQLAATIAKLKNTAPTASRQFIAVFTSTLMLYNFQPESVRELYEKIPYLGIFFQNMNYANGALCILTNAAGTTTAIITLLERSGINTTALASSVSNVVTNVGRECGTTALKYTCDVGAKTIKSISVSTDKIMTAIASKLGDIIGTGKPYENMTLNSSQDSDVYSIDSGSSTSSSQSYDLVGADLAPGDEGSINQNKNDGTPLSRLPKTSSIQPMSQLTQDDFTLGTEEAKEEEASGGRKSRRRNKRTSRKTKKIVRRRRTSTLKGGRRRKTYKKHRR